MSSGSYHPQPVREVTIPKTNGRERKLGIPTISDRIAQEVVKTYLELAEIKSSYPTLFYHWQLFKSI